MMTPAQAENMTARIAFRFLLHALCLLLASTTSTWVAALSLTGSTISLLPYPVASAMAGALMQLALISMLLGGGIYALASLNAASRLAPERLLAAGSRLWTLVCLGTAAAGLLGILARLAWPLALGTTAVVAITVYAATQSRPRSALFTVWAAGLGLLIAGILIGLLPAATYFQATLIGLVADTLRARMGVLVSAVALVFWLLHRVSNVTLGWATLGVKTCGGLLALAGACSAWPALAPLLVLDPSTPPALIGAIGLLAAVLLVSSVLIVAAHLYGALSDRNPTHTLAAHWLALFAIALLLGGFAHAAIAGLGTVAASNYAAGSYAAGSRLDGLGDSLWMLALITLTLGLINQIASELRGHNARITGLVPWWGVLFGGLGAALALLLTGVVQMYLRSGAGLGYAPSEVLIAPLYALYQLGLVVLLGGLAWFTLAAWMRHPFRQASRLPEVPKP